MHANEFFGICFLFVFFLQEFVRFSRKNNPHGLGFFVISIKYIHNLCDHFTFRLEKNYQETKRKNWYDVISNDLILYDLIE